VRAAPLDAMDRRKILTPRQVRAGKRFFASYSLGVMGLRQDHGHGRRVPVQFMEAKIAAEDDYNKAVDLLGSRLWPTVWAVICGDHSVQEHAALKGQNPVATMTMLRLGLDLLADHYGLEDKG
jgi:hypothetical protein